MKKVLSLTLIFLLLLSSVPTFAFNDVSKKDWHEAYVTKAVELKLVKGYKDGSFKPENNVTVAEFISMTLNAMYSKDPAPEIKIDIKDYLKKNGKSSESISNSSSGISWSDSTGTTSSSESNSTSSGVSIGSTIGGSLGVPGIGGVNATPSSGQSSSNGTSSGLNKLERYEALEGKWYHDYMFIADGVGLVDQSQISSSYFERNITRAEMAKVLDAAIRYFDQSEPVLLGAKVFADQIDLKYKLSVHNLYEKKIISGYSDGTFRPNNKATRAEAAVMILKMIDPSYR